MKSKSRPLIVTIVTVAALDLAGIITMIANPDLTARLIPALVAIQILGFIAIAFVCMARTQTEAETAGSQGVPTRPSKEWAAWVLGFLAMIYLIRALLAIAYMSANGWHKQQLVVPIAGVAISGYLIYLAFAIRRSMRRRAQRE